MTRIFRHGDFRLYVLKLLEKRAHHGYELIRLLSDEFGGAYSPSAGTVYPRLAALDQAGLVERVDDPSGRRAYRLTAEGRRELRARAGEIRDVGQRIAAAGRLTREIRQDVRAQVRELRQELRAAGSPAAAPVAREERGAGMLRGLTDDLEAFVADVLAVARARPPSRERIAAVRATLREARAAVIEALRG